MSKDLAKYGEERGKILIDLDTIVNHLNGSSDAMLKLQKHGLCITPITVFELYKKFNSNKNDSVIIRLLRAFDILTIDSAIAHQAKNYAKAYKFNIIESFDAAVAAVNQIKYLTHNKRKFKDIKGLKII